jgi:hypothetical protein
MQSDQEMMKEIASYVAACSRNNAAAQKRKIKDPNSPYLLDQTKLLPPECFPVTDSLQTRERIRQRVQREALRKRKPSDPDEILNYYAAQQRKDLGISKETLDAKALTLPFGDTMSKITEYVALERTVRNSDLSFESYNARYTGTVTSRSASSRSTPHIPTSAAGTAANEKTLVHRTALPAKLGVAAPVTPSSPEGNIGSAPQLKTRDSRFHRKYPRLCESLRFTDNDIVAVNTVARSDFWMARFIEDCYDEAYTVCNTQVSQETKWRLRNGLDLGSMESFPKVVDRLLHIRYSTLEVRTQICLEFLCGLERLLAVSEVSRTAELPITASAVQERGEQVYDGQRAQLFSKFLSEEYDLDYLAMFLHTRETVQSVFQFKLREVNQARIWLDDSVEAEEDLAERGVGLSATTYYRVQQRAQSTDGAKYTQRQTGGKRKIAWSAETMTLTAKLDAQIGTRKAARRSRSAAAGAQESGAVVDVTQSPTKRRSTSVAVGTTTKGQLGHSTGQAEPAAALDKNNMTIADKLHPSHEGRKVVPVTLPNNWHFLHDLTLPEAPLVGFDTALISVLCMHLLPGTSQSVRTYLTDRVVTATREAIMDTTSAITSLAADASVVDATGRVSLSTARAAYAKEKVVRVIPLYVLLKTLCLEWKKLSLETKVSFIESGAGAASLKSLNAIYENNSELMRNLDATILDVQKALGVVAGRVLALEKIVRRLDRRRMGDTVTSDELVTLEEARVQLNGEKMTR